MTIINTVYIISVIIILLFLLFSYRYYQKRYKNLIVGSFGLDKKQTIHEEYLKPLKKQLMITFIISCFSALLSLAFMMFLLVKFFNNPYLAEIILQITQIIIASGLTFSGFHLYSKILDKYSSLVKKII